MKGFEDLGLNEQLKITIKGLGFTKPTQIQEESIPPILASKDVVGESATGSGKTLAFGCGIIEKVVPREGLQALVLTPTRELAEQVKESIKSLSRNNPLNMIAIYGGVSIERQIHNLPKSEVVIATPGRLLDHLERGTIDISKVKILVLDEADRMLDMGFIEDVEKIIKNCPKERQTLFFSATISQEIQKLANKYMNNPVKVFAENMVDPSKLKQVYYDVQKNMKLPILAHLLQYEKSELIMVFCNTRRTTDFVVKTLKTNGIKAIAIHGGLTQNKRTNTIGSFNDAKVNVLVCTDVAARGLHINNVTHIYNYDIPKAPTDYIHRIGRTARAGEEGKVINLLSHYDHESFSKLIQEHREFNIERIENPQVKRIEIIRPMRHSGHGQRRQNNRPRRKTWN